MTRFILLALRRFLWPDNRGTNRLTLVTSVRIRYLCAMKRRCLDRSTVGNRNREKRCESHRKVSDLTNRTESFEMNMSHPAMLEIVDTHTGGEPTRIVISGGPDLGTGSLADRRAIFSEQFDRYRTAVVNEPRGSDVMIGALLCEPVDPSCAAGVIFFNNIGMLHMCGHGTIGLVVALEYLGRIQPGKLKLETPVGSVGVEYLGEQRVQIENVPSYRYAKDVQVTVPGEGPVRGDIAWGGNWFFLIGEHRERIDIDNVSRLTEFASAIREQLDIQRITGADGGQIDHIELFASPDNPQNHSKNFVLCPGLAYDRSPCGTGTSAKLACLAADGKLLPGEVWRQESIVGSLFEGSFRSGEDESIIPSITGTAYVNAETKLILNENDPFCWGMP